MGNRVKPASFDPDKLPLELLRAIKEACGFAELGMHQEAGDALLALQMHEEWAVPLLMTWCEILASRKEWLRVRETALELTTKHPEVSAGWFWLGFSTRRAVDVQAAYEALKPVTGRFEEDPVVDYNFACYACLCGKEVEARESLVTVFKKDKKWVKTAQEDPDLEALRPWILGGKSE